MNDGGTFFTSAETELFKNAGGFNNDFDLANAAVALLCAKHAEHPELDTAQLRDVAPDLIDYSNAINQRGGGIVNAESVILNKLGTSQRRDFARTWNPKLVTQLFQEMYAGQENCRRIYGFTPEHIQSEGFLEKEPILLNAKLLPAKTKIGVLTGRTKRETQIALERSGLRERVLDAHLVTDDDNVRKPDGRALALLQERMKFRNAIYVGDTPDDLKAVQNFRDTNNAGKARIWSCQVLSGPSGDANKKAFLEAGAEIVAPDVNSVLQYLSGVLK
jgi:HAD superfamily hydrolase (TIGR01548 family)